MSKVQGSKVQRFKVQRFRVQGSRFQEKIGFRCQVSGVRFWSLATGSFSTLSTLILVNNVFRVKVNGIEQGAKRISILAESAQQMFNFMLHGHAFQSVS